MKRQVNQAGNTNDKAITTPAERRHGNNIENKLRWKGWTGKSTTQTLRIDDDS